MRTLPITHYLTALCALSVSSVALAGGPDWKSVEATLSQRCYECHGGAKTKGDINLKELATDPKLSEQFELWEKVQDTITNGDMPPPKAKQLTGDEENLVTTWVTGALDALAEAKAGDPGPVTMRRLTNAEYDFTIRDLTGQDFRMAREFQTDGGGGEGFSNTGDVLFISPQQLDKYLAAARKITDHASVLPGTGIVFHAQRLGLRGPEQWKAQAEQGLYVWYQQKAAPHLPKDFDDMREADYMIACWRHLHFQEPLEKLAQENQLQLPFLENWWRLVKATEPKSRFLDLTRATWRELPGPDAAKPGAVPEAVTTGSRAIQTQLRSWNNPKKPGSGVQRQQQDADGLRSYAMTADVKGKRTVLLCIGDLGDGNQGDLALVTKIEVRTKQGPVNDFDWLRRQVEEARKAGAAAPATAGPLKEQLAGWEKILGAFGKHPQGRAIEPGTLALAAPQVLPLPLPEDANFVHADVSLDMKNPEVDAATIQWTLATDQPPDVKQIIPGVLTIWKRQTEAARRVMGDFGVMKMAFPDMFERRLEQVATNLYRGSPGIGVYYLSDEQLAGLLPDQEKKQLESMRKDWSFVAQRQLNPQRQKEWDALVQEHLQRFAARAWRRPLSPEEKGHLGALYQTSVTSGLDRESAAREVLVRVLVSPHFIFKPETLPVESRGAAPEIALTDWEVASRLSYFLWSSLPDWQLRQAAEKGTLLQPGNLEAQTKRLLKDPKVAALSVEFAGQWLGFNGFDAQNTVDEKKFPEFTPELRADLYRESVTFFTNLFRDDRPVGDIVGADYTFLNERLAKFYGISGVTGPEFREVKVADHQRGGVLGMGSILTKTSRPNRTSPVVRGNYLYQVVLGQSSPPPPPNVPKLPESAVKPSSLREALKIHREDAACSVCHDRIDPLGFALESFDPIGRFRPADESGGKVDDTSELKDGTRLEGIAGLRKYLLAKQSNINGQFCRKLLGYALGRQTLPTDKPLLTEMQAALAANQGHVSAAVLTIVKSRQFLNRRVETTVTSAP